MKKDYLLIFDLILLVILEGIIFIVPMKINISDKIQGGSIIALVLITLYYAMQTRILAEEQSNTLREMMEKRKIEFLERRLNEFYMPATLALLGIKTNFSSANLDGLRISFLRLQVLDMQLGYFASGNMRTLFREFLNKFDPYIHEGGFDKLKEGFPEIVDKLGVFLQMECNVIEKKIRYFYRGDEQDDFLEKEMKERNHKYVKARNGRPVH
jgi:hypothetical protein